MASTSVVCRAGGTAVAVAPRPKVSDGPRQPVRPWREQALPIQAILPEILETMRNDLNLVLQAPTGAGKTTLVPLALLESGAVEGRILVLQPRRITCVTVARRMALLWGEAVGQTVGYRIRHESVVGNMTRIEVVTEGILTRMLHTNPSLEGVGCIFFDEFHERNLDSDLSFALCRAAQQSRKLKTRLVIMSATFGALAERVSGLLSNAKMIRSEGQCFPVEIRYRGLVNLQNYEPEGPLKFAEVVARAVRDALEEHAGDALVFLPGEREIMYTWIALNNLGIGDGQRPRNLVAWAHKLIDESAADPTKRVQVSPLYSTLEQNEQDEVLRPPAPGWRKVILATPIAESSLTVPGVKIVVDCGLRRVKVEDTATCMNYMRTQPISASSAAQRSGRAGRVSEGVCYRLWSEEQQQGLEVTDSPEIHRVDLAAMVLDLAFSGYASNAEITRLPWVDPPTVEALEEGRRLLLRLHVLERRPGGQWALTPRGQQVGCFPLHPRLGHMIRQACMVSDSFARDACDLAALLEEKELLRGGRSLHGADLEARLDAVQTPGMPNVYVSVRDRVLQASAQLQNLAELRRVEAGRRQQASERQSLCVLLAWAFPELLAEAVDVSASRAPGTKRGGSTFRLANGSEANIDYKDALSRCKNLAIAALTGPKVFWAMRADPALLASYGVDVKDPVKHQVLGVGPAGATELDGGPSAAPEITQDLLPIRRYLTGKACGPVSSASDLLTAMMRSPAAFSAAELVAMLWDLACAEPPRTELLRRLAEEVVQPRLAEFTAVQLAEAACALAVARVSQGVFPTIAEAVLPKLEDLPLDSERGNLSSLLWAFTAMEVADEGLTQAMARRAVKAMCSFQPRVLSEVREVCFWSFHRASAGSWSNRRKSERLEHGFAYQSFFEALAPTAVKHLAEINPITCVYLMWTFSKAGVQNEDLFSGVVSRVGPDVRQLDRCGLTMFCWNFSYIGVANDEVYRLVAEETLRPERMAEMAPRDVSGVAWAFGKARITNKALMDGLASHACGLLRDGITQCCYRGSAKSLFRDIYMGDHSAVEGAVDAFDMVSLADMLWACSALQFPAAELIAFSEEYLALGLGQETSWRAARLIRYPQALVKVLYACASFPGQHTALFDAAAPHCLESLGRLGARDVASLLWAWAMAGTRDAWVLAELDRRMRKLILGGQAQALSQAEVKSLAWALAELGLGDKEVRASLAGLGT